MADQEKELLQMLAEMRAADDPVPSIVREMAYSIPDIQRLDTELAELVEQEALVRDAEDALVFEADEVSIVLESDGTELVVDVLGSPIDTVELELASGARQPLSEAAGTWRVVPAEAGPIRIVVTTSTQRLIGTSWFTVPKQA